MMSEMERMSQEKKVWNLEVKVQSLELEKNGMDHRFGYLHEWVKHAFINIDQEITTISAYMKTVDAKFWG
jgi:hypothetical protein